MFADGYRWTEELVFGHKHATVAAGYKFEFKRMAWIPLAGAAFIATKETALGDTIRRTGAGPLLGLEMVRYLSKSRKTALFVRFSYSRVMIEKINGHYNAGGAAACAGLSINLNPFPDRYATQ